MKKKILLPEKIIKEGMELLALKEEVVISQCLSDEDAILNEIEDVFGIVLRSGAKITKKIIDAANSLKIISRTGAGYDNVDVKAATDKGIIVCNLPGINSVSVAEHTIALLFSLMKCLNTMQYYMHNDQWNNRSTHISREIEGKTIGIVGLGKIGYTVMKKCKALGMNVIVYDPYKVSQYGNEVAFVPKIEDILENSDIVSMHVPNIPETKGMITGDLIDLMKTSAYFINTSRGEVVDEIALVERLRARKIAGAGLDVFAQEPIAPNNPLLQLDNVIITPHVAALTKECGVNMTVEAVKQVFDLIDGKIPVHIVNKEELDMRRYTKEI